MAKQTEIHGRRVQLYSLDEGRTWPNSPQSIVAYRQRPRILRLDLQKRNSKVYVNLSRVAIKSRPEFDSDKLDREYETQLYKHYGQENYW